MSLGPSTTSPDPSVSQVTRPRLIVFTRYPEPGKVKTRLCGVLGTVGAAELHRELTEHTLAAARGLRSSRSIDVEVRYSGGDDASMRRCFGDELAYRPQGEGDLGERMARSIAVALSEGAPVAVVIGSDCPGITPDLLGRAFDMLGEDPERVILGPAFDGGYYLIGMSRERPELFQEIAWGTEHVFRQTETLARNAGYPLRTLEPLADIDRPEDLDVWYSVRGRTKPRVSVIIPALNEEAAVARAVESAMTVQMAEVIVVDGGSRDRTSAVAASSGASVILSRKGRAIQMNAGAARASGDVLVFLHADTVLPVGYDLAIARTLDRPGTAAGAFRLSIAGGSRSLRVIESLVHWRSTALGLPYGDQAIFLTAEVFRRVGGFPELPIMEDLELTRRLKPLGQIRIAPEPVVTSARRWHEGGVWRTTLRNQFYLAAYFAGVRVERIAAWRGTHTDQADQRILTTGDILDG